MPAPPLCAHPFIVEPTEIAVFLRETETPANQAFPTLGELQFFSDQAFEVIRIRTCEARIVVGLSEDGFLTNLEVNFPPSPTG